MPELKQLTEEELLQLHAHVIEMREQVLDFVQKYDFDANALVSKTFQKAIETEFGRKYLKRMSKENE